MGDRHPAPRRVVPGGAKFPTRRSSSPVSRTRTGGRPLGAGPEGGRLNFPPLIPVPRLCRQRPHPRADRGNGLRRLRPGDGCARPRLRRSREADAPVGGARREPRRHERRATRDIPAARRARAGRRPARGPELTNDRRLDVPSTVVCTSITSDQIKAAVEEGYAWIGGLAELRDVAYVDLPTSHWPMWSRPQELAAVIGDVARGASAG